jgi:uncharacterized membrane protein YcaP (DUF421 family)
MGYERKMKKRKHHQNVDEMGNWEMESNLRAIAKAKALEQNPETMKKIRAYAKDKLDEHKHKRYEADAAIELGTREDV